MALTAERRSCAGPQPMDLSALRAELENLEQELNAGAGVRHERLRTLERHVRHWTARRGDGHPAVRFAKILLRAKEPRAARRLVDYALGLARDDDGSLSLLLANAAAACGEFEDAFGAVAPFVEAGPGNAAIVGRAAEFRWKAGDIEKSLKLYAHAASIDPAWRSRQLDALAAADRQDEALAQARRAIRRNTRDIALAFSAFKILSQFGCDPNEIARARAHVFANVAIGEPDTLWRARVFKWEQNFEAALAELNEACKTRPGDDTLLRERAETALLHGYWGRDAAAIADVAQLCREAPEFAARIANADRLLAVHGGSLADAAKDPRRWAQVRSPESVFDLVVARDNRDAAPRERGLVMIAHSLVAGGAERIVAGMFRRLREEKRFDWVKLYLIRLSPDDGTDFYLPLAGIGRDEAIVLDRDAPLREPFAFLPQDAACTAQAIHDRLLLDRPSAVHVSLEPLTLYGGLAALEAGVPRIVLHTHNMRPTSLYPGLSMPRRWRECYAALMRRKEVNLVCCARAAMRDYAQWIELDETPRLNFVHNGSDFKSFAPVSKRQRAALRAEFGFPAAVPMIGTAFKFREEKRPVLWVEAACAILEQRPDARFVLFGDGPLLAAAREAAAARGHADKIAFPGLVCDIHRLLPMLDLFMLTSSSEALPNVLLEAQATGVPVIAPDVGGIAETMIEGRSGILVRSDEPKAYAAAVLEAIADPAWRAAAAAHGVRFVRENFSQARMMQGMYRALLGEESASQVSPLVRPARFQWARLGQKFSAPWAATRAPIRSAQ